MVTKIILSYSRGEQIFYLYLLLINLISFGLMGIDKYKASKEKWRIREVTLIFSAFIGGSIGILFGMVIFKHKVNKIKFYTGIPLLYIFNLITIILARYYLTN